MRNITFLLLIISNACLGQDYDGELQTNFSDPPNTIIQRYNFVIKNDSIIKPDLFEVYFTLSEKVINTYHKKKYYSRIIGTDSAYKELIINLLALEIDTTGIKTVSVIGKDRFVQTNLNNKIIYLKINSSKVVELLRDSIRFPGLFRITAEGYVTQSTDSIEKDMLRKSLIEADIKAADYAKTQGLKVKIRETVSTRYYNHQKYPSGAIYDNNYDANYAVNLDDIIYSLYLTVTYVLE